MNRISLTIVEAREQFADMINQANYGKQRIEITRFNNPVAALVSMEDLLLIEKLEAHLDLQVLFVLLQERGSIIAWNKVKAALGLKQS